MPNIDEEITWPGWETMQLIGHGSFGAVYEIERDVFGHKEKAALKVISIPQNESDIDDLLSDGYDEESITTRFEGYLHDIVREYSMMAEMKGCANIVYCDDVKYIQHDNGIGWDIFIKMELLTALTKAIGKTISDDQVIKIGMDICNALTFCEKRNVLHRDIKPQNIFIAPDGTYKLGDFGIAKTAERTTSGTKTGTYKYMAPEVYNNQPYGTKADVYSLGLVLYWLLNDRRTPFLPLPPETPTASDEDKARNKRFSGVEIPEPHHGSEALKRVVLKACAFNPKDRYPSAAEMYRDLSKLSGTLDIGNASSIEDSSPEENLESVVEGLEDSTETETAGIWKKTKSKQKEGSKVNKAPQQEDTIDVFGENKQQLSSQNIGDNQTVGAFNKHEPKTPEPSKKKTTGKRWLTVSAIAALLTLMVLLVLLPRGTNMEEDSSERLIREGDPYSPGLVKTDGILNPTIIEDQRIVVERGWVLGLTDEGTVLVAGEDDPFGANMVSDWTDIVAIDASANGESMKMVLGLKKDGTVVSTGWNLSGECNVSDWTDIVQIETVHNNSYGLRADGTMVAAGDNRYGDCNVDNITNGAKMYLQKNSANCTLVLNKDGTVEATGNQQRFSNTSLSSFKGIASLYLGWSELYGVTNEGKVVSTNKLAPEVSRWTDIQKVFSCGGLGPIIGLRKDGTILAYFEDNYPRAEEIVDVVETWTDIKDVIILTAYSDYEECTVIGVKKDGSLVSTGGVALTGFNNIRELYAYDDSATGFAYLVGLRNDGTVICNDPAVADIVNEWKLF